MSQPSKNNVLSFPAISRNELSFDEFDALLSTMDGRTILTGPEKSPFQIDRLAVGDLSLEIVREGGANIYEGAAERSMVSLVIGLPSQQVGYGNGVKLDSEHMIMFRPGDSVTSYCRDVCRYALMSIPMDLFVNMLDEADPSLTGEFVSGPNGFRINKNQWHSTMTGVCRVHDRMSDADFINNRSLQQAALAGIAQSYIDTLVGGKADRPLTGRPRVSRRDIIARVIESLDSSSYFKYSIKEMARYTGVTERTFRSVCNEHLGISPKKYIMMRQMNDIRNALMLASKQDRVSQIASRFGVWDWGRFSARYRAIYGETPSETILRVSNINR